MSVTRAIILAGETAVGAGLNAETRLAGLSLLQRAVFSAQHAGIQDITVVGEDADRARAQLEGDSRLSARLTCVTSAGSPHLEWEPRDTYLVLPLGTLIKPAALRELEQGLADSGQAGVWRGPDGEAALALVSGKFLAERSQEAGLVEALDRLLTPDTTPEIHVSAENAHVIHGDSALATADRWLYRDMTSDSDGYLDRLFNRRLSAWFTRRIINLPITPNQVTLIHFALGLGAAVCFWLDHYWLGVLGAALLQYSVALDCSDGEVARLKYQFTKWGSRLDVIADNVVNVAVFVAIARATADAVGSRIAILLGISAGAGVVMSVLVILGLARMLARQSGASALAAANRLDMDGAQQQSASEGGRLDAVINEITSRDFTILIVIFALLGRLDWMAWLAAVGSHVFWVAFAGLAVPHARVDSERTGGTRLTG